MALYKITVKTSMTLRGARLEKGMSVQVACIPDPIVYRNGQEVSDAFMRIYGIDLKKIGAANRAFLNVEKIQS